MDNSRSMGVKLTNLGTKHSFLYIFLFSIIASILGIAASFILFPQEASIISVFLTSFTLLALVNKLFDINRQEIWENITTPYQANKKLGLSLLIIFIGIMLGYSIYALTLDPDKIKNLFGRQLGSYKDVGYIFTLSDIDFGTFNQLLKHNLTVLLVVLQHRKLKVFPGSVKRCILG